MTGRYALEEQVGFLLRQASQRHAAIFAALMPDGLTPTQWAALVKLFEAGPCSQNHLGRQTAMDAATIKGVVDRLTRRGLTTTQPDSADARRLLVALTEAGRTLFETALPEAERITQETLAPLGEEERALLLELLGKLR